MGVLAGYGVYFGITTAMTLLLARKLRRKGYMPSAFYLVCIGFALLVAPIRSLLAYHSEYAVETIGRCIGGVLIVTGLAYGAVERRLGSRTPGPVESNGHHSETTAWDGNAPISKVLD